MKPIKKVCCYFRVSSDKQVEADTIAAQREFLPAWVRKQGWEVALCEMDGR
jgi:DNA invertase Pin-like site-specific DNA recombinase